MLPYTKISPIQGPETHTHTAHAYAHTHMHMYMHINTHTKLNLITVILHDNYIEHCVICFSVHNLCIVPHVSYLVKGLLYCLQVSFSKIILTHLTGAKGLIPFELALIDT